jgi:hypothetical protein
MVLPIFHGLVTRGPQLPSALRASYHRSSIVLVFMLSFQSKVRVLCILSAHRIYCLPPRLFPPVNPKIKSFSTKYVARIKFPKHVNLLIAAKSFTGMPGFNLVHAYYLWSTSRIMLILHNESSTININITQWTNF